MPANMVLLNEQTLNASAASVTFASIPQTGYTDLKVVMSYRTSESQSIGPSCIQFNGVTTSYSSRELVGTGSGTSSTSRGVLNNGLYLGNGVGNTATANTFGNMEIYIPNYTNANNKSLSVDNVGENNATAAYATMIAGLWSNTAAITSILLYPFSGATNFVAGSTFSLYGIAAVGVTPTVAPHASGGNVITNDGTYWYHAFLSSGTFIPNKALSCDYLVVAGGGAGGAADSGTVDMSGGGGGGGLRSTVTATGRGGALEPALALTLGTSYAITIGAGGSATAALWTNGSNSTFSTITSIGGGIGAGLNTTPGWVAPAVGGSGGGGSEASLTGAPGTTNQGYDGGTSPGGPSGNSGGGGGGAGAAGGNGSTNVGGAGGAGVAISVLATATGTGVSNYYAGGGGGSGSSSAGAGGSGGGGTGNATAGTVNTGGGGGSGSRSGAAGGSGIVIVRYLMTQ